MRNKPVANVMICPAQHQAKPFILMGELRRQSDGATSPVQLLLNSKSLQTTPVVCRITPIQCAVRANEKALSSPVVDHP
jgi:hypothetical protein